MNLIFIYGPPAAGKLTVAQELQKITGYRLFHNMLTVDLALSVLDWDNEKFQDLTTDYRLETFKHAARAKVDGLIFTFAYVPKLDDGFVKKVISRIKKDKGNIYFVQLVAKKEELLKRVGSDSRKKLKKLVNPTILKESFNRRDLYAKIPFVESYSIDTTNLSPKKVSQMIKENYKIIGK